MKIVFMGTPEIAVPALRAIAAKYDVAAAVCQPDKAVGRKQIMTAPAVKQCANELGIPVFQPASIKKDNAFLFDIAPDMIVVMAYGKILPPEVIALPKYGCINLHGSLLPKYRGSAPIQWSLYNGDTETGITVMRMDEHMDTGDIIKLLPIEVSEQDTAASMFEKLAKLAAKNVCLSIEDIESGKAVYTKQDDNEATMAPMIKKEDALVNFDDMTGRQIVNAVRAFDIWPGAYFAVGDSGVKITSATYADKSGEPGTIASLRPLVVYAKTGAVELVKVKPQNSREMTGAEYIVGRRLKADQSIK